MHKVNGRVIANTDGLLIRQTNIGGISYARGWDLADIPQEDKDAAGVVWVDVAPATEPTPIPKTTFTRKEWVNKFTDAEQGKYYTLLTSDPQVVGLDHMMMTSDYIDINSVGTSQGLDLLVLKGVLTEERKAEMLTAD